jgi:uncharacterized protein (DUF1330 family)
MGYIQPNRSGLAALTTMSNAEPVVMLNMLRFRDHAQYPEGSGHAPCSGREAYQRYGAIAVEHVRAVGGKPLYRGTAHPAIIGPEDELWHEILLVQYPSPEAFLKMVANPDYLACSVHRTAALEDSRLIPTRM